MKAAMGYISAFCVLMFFGGLYLYVQLDNKVFALNCQIQTLQAENIKLQAELVSTKYLVTTGQLEGAESSLQMLRLQSDLLNMSQVLKLTLMAFIEMFEEPSPQQPTPEAHISPRT